LNDFYYNIEIQHNTNTANIIQTHIQYLYPINLLFAIYKLKMNLFILSIIQREIAQFMMDKHVSKILLEAVQMLCSAKRILDPEDEETNTRLYKLAHKNHPVTIWCRKSRANYIWTLDLIEELHKDYRDLT